MHLSQVHKEQLTEIENALPNRAGIDVEIFGMEGIPDDVLHAHRQRVATQFAQAEAERQAATGNPPAGSGGSGQPAKKPKLENMSEMKKRLAEHRAKRAEGAAGSSSREATPVGAGQPAPQAVPTTGSYVSCDLRMRPLLARTNHVCQGQPQATAAPNQQPSYPQPYGGAASVVPHPQTASPGYQTFPPASGQPGPGYPPTGYSPSPFPQQQPTPTESTPPPRPGSVPSLAGLPQRPAFGAPPVNAQQMHQMHMGHPAPPASHANGEVTQAPGAAEAPKTTEEKASKKDKSKTRLVYSDETVSPEEKMAQLPRYAFTRDRFPHETALGEVPGAVVVGAIRDSDTIIDPAH